MDSVFLRENRGHLSENLSTKNYSFGAKMRIIRRLPPNGSHPLRIPRNTRAQVKLAKSLAWPKEWGPCCVAFGSAKGSVFCLIYNFILLYSSVPLLELLIWARSSVWESVRFASVRSRVRSPSGPPHSGDLVLRSPEFFHAFRMRDSTHSCPLPDTGSRRTV